MAKIKAVRTRQRGKTFSYAFEAGHDENGKRIVIEKGGFATRAEAYEKGTEAFVDFKHGNIGITSEKITVKDYMESWLESVARLNIRESTYENYAKLIKSKIIPYLGNVILQELTPAHIDCMLRKQVTQGFSYGTVSGVKKILSSALKYAVYPAQLIQSNPCLYATIPKKAKKNCVQRSVITPSKLHEVLLMCKPSSEYQIPLLIMYHTGMRVREVLGLTWDSVDLDKLTITVNRQMSALAYKLALPKTDSSIRVIPIDSMLADTLLKWKERQRAQSECPGYVYVYEDKQGNFVEYSKELNAPLQRICLVCTRSNGKFIKYEGLERFLCKFGLNAHSFRHTHATVLIENGATAKGVADRLGHKNIGITQNLYTHATDKMKSDTLAVFVSSQNADK